MVVLKINEDTPQEREVKIWNDKGTWHSGGYHLYAAASLNDISAIPAEQMHDVNKPGYLGEVIVNKEKNSWVYREEKLNPAEQKQIAEFILDYQAPDAVY